MPFSRKGCGLIAGRRIQRRFGLACGGALMALQPAELAAHAAERGFVMLLPTGYYLAGGTIAVAVSFLGLALVDPAWLRRLLAAQWQWRPSFVRAGTISSLLSFLLAITLIVFGLYGSRDPLVNPLPLFVWTLMWVGLTFSCLILGNLWQWLNPFRGPWRLLFGERGDKFALVPLPARLGYGLALPGLLAVGWFELVDPAPDDPTRLGWALSGYGLLTFLAMGMFGARLWLERGECLSVFFRLVAACAPIRWRERKGESHAIGLPGAWLVAAPPLPPSGVAFVLLALAIVSFDGLSRTFWWLGLIGVNPLEFPGRSMVIMANTLGLLGTWIVLALAFVGAVLAGSVLANGGLIWRESVGRFVLSVLPISAGYHVAHYLTQMLLNGQYALLAANDPLGTGADLFGLAGHHVTTSFLSHHASVELIWRFQVTAVVLGHLLAVVVAHGTACALYPARRSAILSQIPLAGLMIGYTLFGLWLLSTPTGI